MLHCSPFVENHDSNSNLKNGDGKTVEVDFWGVFSLTLALKKPLEIPSVKVVKIGILGKIVGGRWDRGS